MKLLKFQELNKDGRPGPSVWINPDKICGVLSIPMPSTVTGPGNETIINLKAGVDLGMRAIPLNMTPEELVKVLENV